MFFSSNHKKYRLTDADSTVSTASEHLRLQFKCVLNVTTAGGANDKVDYTITEQVLCHLKVDQEERIILLKNKLNS